MKKFSLLFLFFVLVFQSCKSQTKKINGLSFVATLNKINQTHIIPVQKVSANYVALMLFGFVKSLSSSKINHNTSRQWFTGCFFWKWFHDYNKSGGAKNTMFTLQNKPAEFFLKELYAN